MGFFILTILTTTQRLEQVQTAITEILSKGQSFALSGRQTTRANLADLRAMERDLLNDYNTETYGQTRNYAQFQEQR